MFLGLPVDLNNSLHAPSELDGCFRFRRSRLGTEVQPRVWDSHNTTNGLRNFYRFRVPDTLVS